MKHNNCTIKDCWCKCETKFEFANWNINQIRKTLKSNKGKRLVDRYDDIDKVLCQIDHYSEMVDDFADRPTLTMNDKINNMTVEEKAEYLERWNPCNHCDKSDDIWKRPCDSNCKESIKAYLEQEI